MVTLASLKFFSDFRKIVRLSRKPNRKEIWLSARICLLGVSVLGVYGFIIMLVSAILRGGGGLGG